jgi:hypothetical protein
MQKMINIDLILIYLVFILTIGVRLLLEDKTMPS